MSHLSKEEVLLGTKTALLKRGAEQRIPKLLDIKHYVNEGRPLSDNQMEFLSQVFKDAQGTLAFVDRHPELRDMTVKAISLYEDIMARATENEDAGIK